MLWLTGDLHGDLDHFTAWGEREREISPEDHLIVCGDFGFVFCPPDSEEYPLQQAELDILAQKPYTILFADGNHENFPLIYSHPSEKRWGGRVHRIRDNIFHLCRGQVFDIDGVRIFTMGGAYSRDKETRREGRSWWEEELPNNNEYRTATQNLAEVGNKVDLIVTHTAPRTFIRRMRQYPNPHDGELTGFLEWILETVTFEKWFFGHWHEDKNVRADARAIYRDLVLYRKEDI